MNHKRSPHLGARTSKPEDIPEVHKTRTQSVLFALPLLMLLAGLYVYYKNERIEAAAIPIEAEAVTLEGSFSRRSSVGTKAAPEFIVELVVDGASWNVHAGAEHAELLMQYQVGDNLSVRAAPKISGSKSLWLLSID